MPSVVQAISGFQPIHSPCSDATKLVWVTGRTYSECYLDLVTFTTETMYSKMHFDMQGLLIRCVRVRFTVLKFIQSHKFSVSI